MTATSLPDRLRALADLIEAHDLPDRSVSVTGAPYNYVGVTAESVEDVTRWAIALGLTADDVETEHYAPEAGVSDVPWTAHSVRHRFDHDGPINVRVQFSERNAAVGA